MNVGSVNITNAISKAWSNIAKSMEKTASMDAIPAAQYDPSGLAISERLKASAIESSMRSQNLAMEMNADMTAEAALGSIQGSVQRINELSVAASNGTLTSQDRAIIQEEINGLKSGIDDIASNTQFNNKQLIAGYTSENLGLDGINVIGNPGSAITSAHDAIDMISSGRASFGSSINAAQKNYENLQKMESSALSSYEGIRGLDIAKEMTEMTKNKMMLEAGVSMLKTQNEMSGYLIGLIS